MGMHGGGCRSRGRGGGGGGEGRYAFMGTQVGWAGLFKQH